MPLVELVRPGSEDIVGSRSWDIEALENAEGIAERVGNSRGGSLERVVQSGSVIRVE
jgi:hypothetical protein